ncbi:metal-binding protein [Arthrospira sp. O9.13F]|nr:metal-binding protein [Arthrospira sp. O9.13F]
MDAIYIPHLLNAHQRTVEFQFEEFIPGLDTLTPVRGYMRVSHKTTFLDVQGRAETIVTLTCDRCLKQYNHRLKILTNEAIWLEKSSDYQIAEEVEVAFEDLVETLDPQGHFSPTDWFYQQLCLELPGRQLCDQDCQLPTAPTEVSESVDSAIDHRWAALEALKKQLSG